MYLRPKKRILLLAVLAATLSVSACTTPPPRYPAPKPVASINIVPPHQAWVGLFPANTSAERMQLVQERLAKAQWLGASSWLCARANQAPPEARNGPVALFGPPQSNPLVGDLLRSKGITVRANEICLGPSSLTFRGPGLQLTVRGENPLNTDYLCIGYITTTDHDQAEACAWNYSSRAQWVVSRNAVPLRLGRFPTLLTPQQMHEDIAMMLQCIQEVHPAPNAVVSLSEWGDISRRLHAQADQGPKTRLEFYRLLAPAVARMREAQTCIFPPLEERPGTGLPFVMEAAPAGCFVTRSQCPQVPRGALIQAINGVPMDQVMRELVQYWGSERPSWITAIVADHIAWWHGVHYGPSDDYRITLVPAGPGAHATTVQVKATPPLEDSREYISWRFVEHTRAAILEVNTFPQGPAFADQLAKAFDEFRAAGVNALIVDLRRNPGGDSSAAELLLKYVGHREMVTFQMGPPFAPFPIGQRFSGRVFVLIGSRTASSAASFAAVVKGTAAGLILGEETGGPYKAYGHGFITELPHSKLELRVSKGLFASAYATGDGTTGVLPDIEVRNTAEDYASGRDAVLEAALSRIAADK